MNKKEWKCEEEKESWSIWIKRRWEENWKRRQNNIKRKKLVEEWKQQEEKVKRRIKKRKKVNHERMKERQNRKERNGIKMVKYFFKSKNLR